ncbi:hypothetical protein ATK17_3871 [Branchiibius hedensis]|uniref:Uncharacterized protein n=1 Tax=Branchiibius hedensis TaxID=672460 RepID=A0A2Y9BPJ1_9MICO|nr:hypothetical protein [Branchiibius hedensis]PWJ23372.1 hypothetical protein ATK17_3871 [Branchiibius hedensis]SSA59060.1 hypothetical protein SAMN04489750_3871 [Branchiibius hedensis]
MVRDWLGTNPRTGNKHLPNARESEAAKARGVGVYVVEDILVDAICSDDCEHAERHAVPTHHRPAACTTAGRTGARSISCAPAAGNGSPKAIASITT